MSARLVGYEVVADYGIFREYSKRGVGRRTGRASAESVSRNHNLEFPLQTSQAQPQGIGQRIAPGARATRENAGESLIHGERGTGADGGNVARVTSTGQAASRITCSATLPKTKCLKLVRPCVAITIKSTASSWATRTISILGTPDLTSIT